MREILFKAKRIDNEEWVTGYYTYYPDGMNDTEDTKHIIRDTNTNPGKLYFVDQSTICQYTGLTDKKGKKIWENDICKYYNPEDKDGIAIIKEDYASWISGTVRQREAITPMFYLRCGKEWEVIGNIFDNPELLN